MTRSATAKWALASRPSNRWRMLVLLAASLIASTDADAAVRSCTGPLSSGPQSAGTETDGQRLALEAWVKQAAAIGPGFTGWRLAMAKSLRCLKGTTGQFVCEARARPCTIQQVPGLGVPQLPPADRVPETRKGLPT